MQAPGLAHWRGQPLLRVHAGADTEAKLTARGLTSEGAALSGAKVDVGAEAGVDASVDAEVDPICNLAKLPNGGIGDSFRNHFITYSFEAVSSTTKSHSREAVAPLTMLSYGRSAGQTKEKTRGVRRTIEPT